jgi:DNA-binding NarL/FixJ family response regulator
VTQIPDHLRLLLSERELLVLVQSLKGTTYKEIASELDIAESTVKTYMKRICDKLGVSGKRKLFQLLSQQDNPPAVSR